MCEPEKGIPSTEDQIGEEVEIWRGCSSKDEHFYRFVPQNGEYIWNRRRSDCQYRKGMEPIECGCGGSDCKKGKRGFYTRVAFNGDKVYCCMGNAVNGLINNLTCHPSHRKPNEGECPKIVEDHCKKNPTDPECKYYCNRNMDKSWCTPFLDGQCTTFFDMTNKDICNKWCNGKNCMKGYNSTCTNIFRANNSTDDKVGLFNESIKLCDPFCDNNSQTCFDVKKKYCRLSSYTRGTEGCKKWCVNNPKECLSSSQNLCNDPDKIFSDNVCSNYCSGEGKAWCDAKKKEFCNTNMSDQCIAWCSDNNGDCDIGMVNHCSKKVNKDKNECKCINSKARLNGKYNPLCVDADCSSVGYYTTAMLDGRGNGCQIVDCSQYIDLKDISAGGGVKLTTELEQKCGNEIRDSDGDIDQSDRPPTTPTINNNNLAYSIAGIGILVVTIATIIGIIYALTNKKDKYAYERY